jgi:hypothetical protein
MHLKIVHPPPPPNTHTETNWEAIYKNINIIGTSYLYA